MLITPARLQLLLGEAVVFQVAQQAVAGRRVAEAEVAQRLLGEAAPARYVRARPPVEPHNRPW